MESLDIWADHELMPEKTTIWQCGVFSLYLKNHGVDLLLAPFYQEEMVDVLVWINNPPEPKALEWKRWAVGMDHVSFRLRPCLPDRPLVVHARRPFVLPAGDKALFYVHIPVSVTVHSRDANGRGAFKRLDTFPSVILSETWFGDMVSGVFCYALKSPARRLLEDIPNEANRALCSVEVHNKSRYPLDYHKICLHTQYLNVYQGAKSLWTNQVHVEYFGPDQMSQLRYDSRAPRQAESPKLLTPAAQSPEENFFSRTFMHGVTTRQKL